MLSCIVLLVGFVMLIKGADVFVESSSSIAKKFRIPPIIIGLTIVAMGTSAPELSVSLTSSLAGMNDLSVANVVGSNIFNVLCILGVSSLMNKLKISNMKDVVLLLGVSLLLLLTTIDGTLGVLDGLVFLGVFAVYIFNMIVKSLKNKTEVEEDKKEKSLLMTIVLGVIGLACIIYGGNLVVDSASAIATMLGMSENLIGLTIVALGTSLPEFITSVLATKKGELDIAIGNVVGSNIFNILLVLGVASTINPITVSILSIIDIIVMVLTISLVLIFTHKKRIINKGLGLSMIVIYVIYIISTIIR